MIIAGTYSFNNGEKVISSKFPELLKEVKDVIAQIDAKKYQTKISKEKTMKGKKLFSPVSLNSAFKKYFNELAWQNYKVKCDYPTQYYAPGYKPAEVTKGAFRDMDFVKRKLGVEVQFGKYSFMVYNVCAKMTIFKKLGAIDVGIEIVPMKRFAEQMSTGVSFFEQFVWDLENRGVADIDIPVLILGIDI